MRERWLQFRAPLDLTCAQCGKVGVVMRVVFPVSYSIDWENGAQFSTPGLGVPVQLACRHCHALVNYGAVGEIIEGNLHVHEPETSPAADRPEAVTADH